MSGKTLTTTVSINGDIDASVQKAFARMSDNLLKIQKAATQASGATDKLSLVIEQQSDELEAAKRAYTDYILGGERSRKKAKELANNVKKLAKELGDNEEKLQDAQDAADKLAGSLKKTGKAAEDSKDGFTVMKGAAAELVADGIKRISQACIDAVKNLYGLAESTREYREDMGKLETAFVTAGQSADLATETYKSFYSVLGEEDRSVEAVNHLAKFVETEQDMQKWTNIAAGVWGTFGDSLPIEGLTEAANETAKVGEVTGVLADALNWAGIMQEDFQEYLDKCSSEQERAAYITEMLNGLYGEAADNYRESNASIIEARKANSDYTDTVAKMGEIIEPITTKVQEGFTLILQKVLDLISGGDIEAFGDRIDSAFGSFVENVLPKIISAMDWIADHTGLLTGIAVAIGVVAAAIAVMNTVMAIQNAIMLASPVTWIVLGIVAAVAALIAIIVLCVKHWDTIKAAAVSAVEWIVGAWQSVAAWMNEKVVLPIANFFSNLWGGIKSGIDGMIEFFSNGFQSLVGIVKSPINAIISIINGAIDGINKVGFDIPEWVPIIGGKKFSVNIPKLPTFATGGITNGLSIAGEDPRYPNEYIISMNPAYRSENLSYWAEAGRMLGADMLDFSLGSGTGGATYLSGVTFAPNITVSGNADKQTIMEAIEEEYPEFIDMLETWLAGRGVPVYG